MKSFQYYDKIAHFYDQMYEDLIWKTLRKAVKFYIEETLKYKNFKTVLDVGTGTGYWIDFFLNKGYEVVAVEPSKNMIEIAKKKFNKGVEFFNVKIEDFPETRKFDIINIQGDVLSYVENLEKVLEKLNRLLVKKGIIFATVDSFYFMSKLIKKYGTNYELEKFDKTHVTTVGSQYGQFESRCFTVEDIKKLEDFGFKVLEIRGCGISDNFKQEIENSKIKIEEAEHIYFCLEKR